MAERRMFAKTVIGSGRFLQMPATSRLLYYDLGMEADDDGIVEALRVMRATGATEDDLKILCAKGFIRVLNRELVSFICDWKTNNLIRQDRYKKSVYAQLICPGDEENAGLYEKSTSDSLPDPPPDLPESGKPLVNQMATEDRLGKDRLGISIITASAVSPEVSHDTPGAEADMPKIMIEMPLIGTDEFPITQAMVDEWQKLYPAVDVMQQLRAMRGWCDANPKNKKTKSGVKRFINGWLNREQNRARPDHLGGNTAPGDDRPAGTSFNTNEFFNAALRRSYGNLGNENGGQHESQ